MGNVVTLLKKTSGLKAKFTELVQGLTRKEEPKLQEKPISAIVQSPSPSPAHTFVDITPEDLPSPAENVDFSIVFFKDLLFLASIGYFPELLEEIRQVLCFNPSEGSWKTIYQETLPAGPEAVFKADDADQNPVPQGYQLQAEAVTVPDGKLSSLNLYISFSSSSKSELLKSSDGVSFSPVDANKPGRQIQPFNGNFFALPVASQKQSAKQQAVIYVANAIESGDWQPANCPGFGDPRNQAVTALTVFQNALYAATHNPVQGFQLWKTSADGEPPYSWELVLEKGGYGYALNGMITSLEVFQNCLYGSTSLALSDSLEKPGFFWAGSELYRIYPDNQWDLIVGAPKYSPAGLKVPLSVMGPGFEEPPANPVYPYMAVHENLLYCCVQTVENFNLWFTQDGEQWSSTAIEGLSDAFRVDVQQAISTPLGLVLAMDRVNSVDLSRKQLWLCKAAPQP